LRVSLNLSWSLAYEQTVSTILIIISIVSNLCMRAWIKKDSFQFQYFIFGGSIEE